MAQLTDEQAHFIKKNPSFGVHKLAKRFGVTTCTVRRVQRAPLRGKRFSGISPGGEGHYLSKMTDAQALEALNGKESAGYYSRKFGVHKNTISSLRTGKTWKHLSRQ